jgi:hypothetical protein
LIASPLPQRAGPVDAEYQLTYHPNARQHQREWVPIRANYPSDQSGGNGHNANEAAQNRMVEFRERLGTKPDPLGNVQKHQEKPDCRSQQADGLADRRRDIPDVRRKPPATTQSGQPQDDSEKTRRNDYSR